MNYSYVKPMFLLLGLGFFIFILWIIYLANTGGQSMFFDFIRSFPYGDKVGHVGLFYGLCLLLITGTGFFCLSFGKVKMYAGALFVAVFVIIEELSQLFIALRTFDFADLAADFVGITLASWSAKHLAKLSFAKKR